MEYKSNLTSPPASFVANAAGSNPLKAPLATLPPRFNPSLTPFFTANSSRPGSSPLPINLLSPIPRPRSSLDIPRVPSPRLQFRQESADDEVRNLVQKGFVPYVSVLASSDTENMIKGKGIPGGLLELIAPFGESIPGNIHIRDSIGAARPWKDFGVRFVAYNNYAEEARKKAYSRSMTTSDDISVGGRILEIEKLVEAHVVSAEHILPSDNLEESRPHLRTTQKISPFYSLYVQKLLSAFPVVPHETFSHPVACLIAISSKNTSPIEALRELYTVTSPDPRTSPSWMSKDFLRFYVLVHDEDRDDITKSTALYEQMKVRYGQHCHMLRIRTVTCVSSDDDATAVVRAEWLSATQELQEMARLEAGNGIEDLTPCIFESDRTSIQSLVRDMVQQSIVPTMEGLVTRWSETILSKRKGFGARLASLSKRFTSFGPGRNFIGASTGKSNYNTEYGIYDSEYPEASLRKLADFYFMLRDYKNAHEVYGLLRHDYEHDTAWKYYAGASEMMAISALMLLSQPAQQMSRSQQNSPKIKSTEIELSLQAAVYSYLKRSLEPFYALRALTLVMELFRYYNSTQSETGALLAKQALEANLLSRVGDPLYMERLAICYDNRQGIGLSNLRSRQRKAGFWAVNAAQSWLRIGMYTRADTQLQYSRRIYNQIQGKLWRDNEKVVTAFKNTNPKSFIPNIDGLLDSIEEEIAFRRRELEEAYRYSDSPTDGVAKEDSGKHLDQEDDDGLTPKAESSPTSPTREPVRREEDTEDN